MTHGVYAIDLRQFTGWFFDHRLDLFEARRADIELFRRDMEARGRARSTIDRRLCTGAALYWYGVEEDLLEHSPAVHVRRPKQDYDAHAVGLHRNEV